MPEWIVPRLLLRHAFEAVIAERVLENVYTHKPAQIDTNRVALDVFIVLPED